VRGAEALLRTLRAGGVDACFANPGTSEMHVVAALQEIPEIRPILALFEGVATGAADGYGRMTGRPAATLLHLGPGLANGWANLHNARRAHTPVVCVVGDHATFHKHHDPPLESDIPALAGAVSGWVGRPASAAEVGQATAQALTEASRGAGQVATLVLPADAAWSEGAAWCDVVPPPGGPAPVADVIVEEVAGVLRKAGPGQAAVFVGGGATTEAGLVAASHVAQASGARLLGETFPARLARGGGRPELERLAYLGEMARDQLAGVDHLVLAGAAAPVSFFAYEDQPSTPVPAGCAVHHLAGPDDDAVGALAALAELLGAPSGREVGESGAPAVAPPADGPITPASAAAVIGAVLPASAVVVDESNTSGTAMAAATAAGPPHDWLTLTGGAIGYALPVAVGAAVACPNRPVLTLESDGSAMYTIAALWTMARHDLNVTTVVFANREYAILGFELHRMAARQQAAGLGPAQQLLTLTPPDLDFVSVAKGMGVPATRATDTVSLQGQLARALAEPGPHLVEAVMAGRGR
jgi:acetolactate synthase I/II/III large subunit